MRRNEVSRALTAMERGEDPKAVLEQFSRALTNKFLHAPTSAIKQVEPPERMDLVNALARLHGFDPEK